MSALFRRGCQFLRHVASPHYKCHWPRRRCLPRIGIRERLAPGVCLIRLHALCSFCLVPSPHTLKFLRGCGQIRAQGQVIQAFQGMVMNRNKASIPLTSVTPLAIVMPGGVDVKREVKYREFNKLRNPASLSHDVISGPGVRITEGRGRFATCPAVDGLRLDRPGHSPRHAHPGRKFRVGTPAVRGRDA